MPLLTRWHIKFALLSFVAALFLGVAQAAQAPLHLPPIFAATGPAYIHLLVVGWITQMIFGVAYWMFPRYSNASARGIDTLAVATFVLLNAGLALRIVIEPYHTLHPGAGLGPWLTVSAVAQWLAGIAFVVNTWPRVKGK